MTDPRPQASERALPIVLWSALFAAILFAGLAFLPSETYQGVLARRSGDSAKVLVPLLPRLFLGLAVFAGTVAVASWLFGNQVDGWLRRTSNQMMDTDFKRAEDSSRPAMLKWAVCCLLLALAFDWRAIIWGYFESDDFNFLIDNRTLGFPDIIYAVMNDHVFPLGRIVIRAVHWLFGSQAIAYNCLAVGSLAFLMWTGCLLLLESGVSRLGTLLYAMLIVGWTMWGEFTSGEYILLLYESLTTTALLVGWATIRWRTTMRYRYCWLTASLVAYACFSSISGFWVACAALVFLGCEVAFQDSKLSLRYMRLALIKHWPQLFSIAIPVMFAIVFYVQAYNRPGGPQFLSSAGERHGLLALVIQWLYVNTSAVLSIPLAIPHHLVDFGLMETAMVVSTIAFITVIGFAWPSLKTSALRGRLVAGLLIMGGVSLMICLGRPQVGVGYVVPPKYLFMPYTWTCITLAIVFDGWWHRMQIASRPLYFKACLSGVLLIWTLQGTASVLGSWGMPFFETTRGGEIREHRLEFAAINELNQIIFVPLDQSSSGPLRIVDIPGSQLCNEYPALRFPWGYEPQLANMLDVLADQPKRYEVLFTSALIFPPLTVTRALRTDVSPEFLRLLENSPQARHLYSLPTNLVTEEIELSPNHLIDSPTIIGEVELRKDASGAWFITSDGNTQIELHIPDWQSEKQSLLELAILSPEPLSERALTLSFRSKLFPEPTEHRLPEKTVTIKCLRIDLLQLASFALSERIESLTIHLRSPGVYRLDHLTTIR